MTDDEQLYQAIAHGIQATGLAAHCRFCSQTKARLLLIGDIHIYQLYLNGTATRLRNTNGVRYHAGPDLNDPNFFQKLKQLYHALLHT